MAGKFEIYRDKAGNGEVVSVGEVYKTKAVAVKEGGAVQYVATDVTVKDFAIE